MKKIAILTILLFVSVSAYAQISTTAWVNFSTIGETTVTTTSVDTIFTSDYARISTLGSDSPAYNLYSRDSLNGTTYLDSSGYQHISGIYAAASKCAIVRSPIRWPLGVIDGVTAIDSAVFVLQKTWARDSTVSDTTTTYGLIQGTYTSIDTTDLGQYNDFHGWRASDSVYAPAWLTEQKSFPTTEADTWNTIDFSDAGLDSLLLAAGDTINTFLVGGNDMRRVVPPTAASYSINASWMHPETWYLVVYSSTTTTVASSDSIIANPVRAIWSDPTGRVWWGSAMGLYRQDGDATLERYVYDDSSYAQKSRNNILSGTATPDGTIYTGSLVGLTRHDELSFTADSLINDMLPDSVVRVLVPDSAAANQVWGAGSSYLWLWSDTIGVVYSADSGMAGQVVSDVAIDSTTSLWITTNAGVSRLIGGYWVTYTSADDGLKGDTDNAVVVAGNDSSVWFGGDDGLVQFDGDTTWIDWTDSLPSIRVRDLFYSVSDTTIWVATDSGLAGYRPDRPYPESPWRKYTPASTGDSLPQYNLFSVAVDTGGRVWVGHSTGVTRLEEN